MARRKPVTTPASLPASSPLVRGGTNLALLVLVFLTLSLVVHFVRQVIQSSQLDERRIQLETANAQLEADLVSLRGAVDYVESDVYVERLAREQFGYAREGDIVLLPRFEARVDETLPAPTPIHLPSPEPNWYRWWRALHPEPVYPKKPTYPNEHPNEE